MAALPWVATTYVVTYGGFLLLGGRAGDLLGARPVFLTGPAVFGLSSAVCGAADNLATLVAARAAARDSAALHPRRGSYQSWQTTTIR
jgi:MFS family permease